MSVESEPPLELLAHASYLPRVVAGRTVLSPARWQLDARQLRPFRERRGPGLFRAVQALRVGLGLPRHVAFVEGDNLLPIDLDNVLCVEVLAHLAKGRERAEIAEVYPGPDELCVRGPEGRFAHEIVVPFVVAPNESAPSATAVHPEHLPLRERSFAPGSAWLYAKLYCGPACADEVLRSLVGPVLERARQSGAADGWFFLRYGDPHWHLRVRLHGRPERLLGEAIPALHEAAAPLFERGLVWKVELGTYEREVERYGGPEGVRLAERLFEADSDAALAILGALEGDEHAEARWQMGLFSAASLLDDLGLDPATRAQVIARARDGYGREFRIDSALKRQLGTLYREKGSRLEALRGAPGSRAMQVGLAALAARSERLAPIAAELHAAEAQGRLRVPIAALAPSYLHMSVNRLVRAAGREHELVFYDLLGRWQASRAGRSR